MPLSDPLRRPRLAGWIEGTTLLLPLLAAGPLRHLAGRPGRIPVVGPVQGVALVADLAALPGSLSDGGRRPRDTARAGPMPLRALLNDRWLAGREAAA